MSRRLFLALIMYFAADFAVPFEPGPGPGRFVIEDMEEALAVPRERARAIPSTSRPPARLSERVSTPSRPRTTGEVTRRDWQAPLPLRVVARSDRPASPDAH